MHILTVDLIVLVLLSLAAACVATAAILDIRQLWPAAKREIQIFRLAEVVNNNREDAYFKLDELLRRAREIQQQAIAAE